MGYIKKPWPSIFNFLTMSAQHVQPAVQRPAKVKCSKWYCHPDFFVAIFCNSYIPLPATRHDWIKSAQLFIINCELFFAFDNKCFLRLSYWMNESFLNQILGKLYNCNWFPKNECNIANFSTVAGFCLRQWSRKFFSNTINKKSF